MALFLFLFLLAMMSNRCSTHCCCGSNCTCGDNCRCTETICCCEASLVVHSLGNASTSIRPSAAGAGATTTTAPLPSSSQQPHRVVHTFSVKGMHCRSCVRTVKSALQQNVKDVASVDVDLNEGTVVVITNHKNDAEEMATVMTDVGFEASVLSTDERRENDGGDDVDRREEQEQQQSCSPLFATPQELDPKTELLLLKNHHQEPALASPRSSDDTDTTLQTAKVDLVISGMTCSMCTSAIRSALESTEGVAVGNVRVSLATDTATVEYTPSSSPTNTVQKLVDQVTAIGYTVTDVIDSTTQQDDDDGALQRLQESQQEQVLNKKRAFLTSLVGTIPVFFLTMVLPYFRVDALQSWLNEHAISLFGKHVTRQALILWILATPVQFGSGWSFYRGAWYGLQSGQLGMDVLVAMGTTASYGYALEDALFGSGEGAHFFETSVVLISFVLLGKWLNALAVRRTSRALTQLLQMQPKTALRVVPTADDDGSFDPTVSPYSEQVVSIQRVHPGNILKIKRGASIPADGILVEGCEMTVDQSMITGESAPVLKTPGSIVLGGTVCVETDECFMQVTGVGSSTALSQIVALVKEAQTRQVPIQNLADKISGIFVPTVATLSVICFLVWYTLCNTGVVPPEWYRNEGEATFSLKFAIACLVISCPCALGLATPTAVMVGTGVGAKNGILVKGGDSLEMASKIDSVVFDKTGTLTKGRPIITDFLVVTDCNKNESTVSSDTTGTDGMDAVEKNSCCSSALQKQEPPNGGLPNDITSDRNYTLWLLGSLERNSEHPLAAAVVSYAESEMDPAYLESNPFAQPTDFRAITGRGASGVISGNVAVAVGNRPFCQMMNLSIPCQASKEMTRLEQQGKTAILAAFNEKVGVVMGIADEVKPDAAASIAYLQEQMGMDVWMVTGDNSRTAHAISQRLFLHPDRVIAEALPVAKVRQVRKLQSQGHVVAMIGDGINDSPALAQANVAISLGTGAEIAAEASDMVLVKANVADVCTALDLSRVIFRRIQLNFVWSLLYNCFGIPVAAGVFYPLIRTRLPPTLAALAMALSSLSVVSSSLALRLYKPPDVTSAVANDGHGTAWCRICCRGGGGRASARRGQTPSAPMEGVSDDMTSSLLANDHTAGSTTLADAQVADDLSGKMEKGQA